MYRINLDINESICCNTRTSLWKNIITDIFLLLCLCPATKDCDSSAAAATECATSYKEEPIDLSLGDLLAHAPKWICPVRLLFWI